MCSELDKKYFPVRLLRRVAFNDYLWKNKFVIILCYFGYEQEQTHTLDLPFALWFIVFHLSFEIIFYFPIRLIMFSFQTSTCTYTKLHFLQHARILNLCITFKWQYFLVELNCFYLLIQGLFRMFVDGGFMYMYINIFTSRRYSYYQFQLSI
jgi:hypothetical protein